MSAMTPKDGHQNMAYIEPADAGEWGCDRSSPVNDGWGRIHGADSSSRPFKTKGSWDFEGRTLSYLKSPLRIEAAVTIQRIFHGWEVRRPILSLVVLLAKQGAAHPTEEDIMKFVPLNMHLICNMGINKRKQEKEKGEKLPTLIHAQKKAKGKACDIVGGLYLRRNT